ncbi:MAG: 50S ribosomal protein L10 [Methanosphaera sp.]|uniref:50S ribosomal protein L10 n=1 Tax=Methanosphaera sp. TaxID=2666342 RepID=UPI002E75CC2B|nr:50S ribosomal protein L10 [Methanosphaera sp.]MEE1117409.1 50S ribosomal protein L10 [Methanosphaera sp.]MEE3324265.1 50S ribosomal protein L10 [Methanosphaera sp.]MEE3418680.1 50S ribosomal protein L10 [Methanosphaera sp.]
MPHVADWKKEKVAELEELTNNNEIIGIVNLADIPAPQLQTMRRTLGDKAILKMSRKNFIKIALSNSNKDVEGLADYLEGQPAMVFTEMNPFKLFKILEDSKTEAPAKAGAIAPADIVVPAGDTSFPPGPILGELQQAGIPAKIDKGSIVVQEDATVVKEGEPVPKNVADVLTKLEIYPMEVGMDLLAVCEGDTIYTADVLKIDEEETLQTIATAYQNAINLSVNAGIVNSESAPILIQKAATEAMNLAINANILTSETTDKILSKAYAQMLAVASLLSSDALDDELSEKLNSVPAATEAPADNTEEPEEEEVEEEEDEEESAAAGLGALFG